MKYYIALMIMTILIVVAAVLNGCTYNISMAHTEGSANDVIDDNQSAKPQVSVSVPRTL